MSDNAALLKELEELRAKNAQLQSRLDQAREEARAKLRLKVSEKGAVSLYGVQKFPVTFYRTGWETILDNADRIKAFISAHESELSTKQPKAATTEGL